jgi:hypothetical protein
MIFIFNHPSETRKGVASLSLGAGPTPELYLSLSQAQRVVILTKRTPLASRLRSVVCWCDTHKRLATVTLSSTAHAVSRFQISETKSSRQQEAANLVSYHVLWCCEGFWRLNSYSIIAVQLRARITGALLFYSLRDFRQRHEALVLVVPCTVPTQRKIRIKEAPSTFVDTC